MITIDFDESSLQKILDAAEKQVIFAAMVALNRTATKVRDTLVFEMKDVFDRPTPFTLNSVRIVSATKTNLVATVGFRDLKAIGTKPHYLLPQVYGGSRPFKGFESALLRVGVLPDGWFAVPGPGARLDRYGNMSIGQMVQIQSFFRSFRYASNGPDKQMAGNRPNKYVRKPKNPQTFFVARPGDADWGRRQLSPGVWLREGQTISLVVSFVPSVKYEPIFDMVQVAQKVTRVELPKMFRKALAEAKATAK